VSDDQTGLACPECKRPMIMCGAALWNDLEWCPGCGVLATVTHEPVLDTILSHRVPRPDPDCACILCGTEDSETANGCDLCYECSRGRVDVSGPDPDPDNVVELHPDPHEVERWHRLIRQHPHRAACIFAMMQLQLKSITEVAAALAQTMDEIDTNPEAT
jgi:hypothetical protein